MASKRVGLPVPTVSEWIMDQAGLTRERLGRLMALAVTKTEAQLEATQVKVFQHEGKAIYSEPLVDHGTQAKAAERIMRHFLPRLQADQRPADMVYDLPPWAYGEHEEEGSREGEAVSVPVPPVPVSRPASAPDSPYLPLTLWGGMRVVPYEETPRGGGKNAGPLLGVHEPLENLGGSENPQPDNHGGPTPRTTPISHENAPDAPNAPPRDPSATDLEIGPSAAHSDDSPDEPFENLDEVRQ